MSFVDAIPLIGTGISAIAGLFGGKKSNDTNVKVAREYNQGQMDIARYQNEFNETMWNKQNAYNTPVAQIERMRQAGLNPNLMYGQGNTGNASSAPSAATPNMAKPNLSYQYLSDVGNTISQGVSQYINAEVAKSNINKSNAETDLVRQQITNAQEDEKLKKLKAVYMQYANSKTKDEANFWADRLRSEIANIESRSVLNFANSELADSRRFTLNVLRPLEKQLIQSRVKFTIASTLMQYSNIKLNDSKIDQIANSIQLTDSQITSNNLENIIKTKLLHSNVNLRGNLIERVAERIAQSLRAVGLGSSTD